MKIYALYYEYRIKKVGDDYGNGTGMHVVVIQIADCLEDAMVPIEKELESKKGYIEGSISMTLKKIMPLSEVLDNIKVKLPELVKSAKEREQLRIVAEALNKADS